MARRQASLGALWSRRPLMCPEVGRLPQRYLDGEIDEVRARRIERHLEDCTPHPTAAHR